MDSNALLQAGPAALTAHRRSLKALTGIRFFAAFYVVIFHTRIGQLLLDHHVAPAGRFFQNGYLAVPLFFLLSGLILAYTYQGQIETPDRRRRFWEARFSRIWPVYTVSLLATSLVTFNLPRLFPALATLLMVQAWNPLDPGLAGALNFVCWTLSCEAFFYLVFPWYQLWLERRTHRAQAITLAAMLILCVALNSSVRGLGYPTPGLYRWLPLPLLHLPEFFSGVGLGNLLLARLFRQTVAAQLPAGHPRPLLGVAGLYTWAAALLSTGLLTLPQGRWTSLVVPAFAALLYGLSAESTLLARFLSTPLLLLGGGISYSVYLMQLPVKLFVQALADRLHLASQTARMALSTGLLLLVSLILFKAVEDPARKLLRDLFAGLERNRARRRAA